MLFYREMHGMRRGLGTGMAANGVPVDTVAQVLGHKGTKATKQLSLIHI